MKRLILTFVFVISACSTTQQAADKLQSDFIGKNFDEFVVRYGPPYKKHELNSGDLLYLWNSGVKSYAMPQTTTIQGAISRYSYSETATTTGGGAIKVYCELQIVTSPNGTIKEIKPIRDTIGDWEMSRCAEIFKG